METVKVQEAKTRLSSLLKSVEQGHEVIIARGDRPVARLVPYEDAPRPLGFVRYTVPESFFDPLPEEDLRAWEGS